MTLLTAGAAADPNRSPVFLSDLSEGQRDAEFDRLQGRLPDAWRAMRLNEPDESVVVVPSVSLDRLVTKAGAMNQALEERYLFLLLLLRQPRLRMIYVTSGPVDPSIVEYYLALLPGVVPSHAKARLFMVSVGDSTPRPLTEKLLERPRLLSEIAGLIPNRARCHLIPYTTTTLERDLAIELGVPMFGADPRHLALGTKSGCRRIFDEAGVDHPAGEENLRSFDDIVEALLRLRRARDVAEAMVKLNEGVSGAGNAVVDLRGLPGPGSAGERPAVAARVQAMALEGEAVTHELFFAKYAEHGGIVEERLLGEEVLSPSVQLRVTPLGAVEVLSTHDQILGGPSGQSYLGCVFPAAAAYSRLITRQAEAIGSRLAELGVLGRFAVDFVVTRRGGEWSAHAIEINLRKGGTTHPFLTLQFLTNGRYQADVAIFATPAGREKHLVATDHLEDPALRGLRVSDLFDVIARTGLYFDPAAQTGVVLHMISSVTEAGRIGLTAVGDTRAGAHDVYARAERVLLAEARSAASPRALRD
ncbi:MAG TPA: peptide ligase PGM1-related protein [Intrasporangium sp.]|uniref:peptide ligase PGM1-related protein n=1 Tax=Intrasporangium sp. TaxID=1925024 RepID=UPI002B49D7DF|nr:peptide ligase PGM1-related protein [Intrasporangium sp.]HKX67775.1 peptide ligase PGM1-related protein [Intrasporangium sp.]